MTIPTTTWRKTHTGLPGQINPPYDGSPECPMCSNEIRSIWATTHNMLNRWRDGTELPESKFWTRIYDLAQACDGTEQLSNPKRVKIAELILWAHPDVRPFLETVEALVRCRAAVMAHDPDVTPQRAAAEFKPFVDTLRQQLKVVAQLNEAHFDDARHSTNMPNILRAQKGYSDDRGGNYDWTVDVADAGASSPDLRHRPCGTGLIIHAYFRERLQRDPAWFGQVWCPTCRLNAPWAQFECRVVA